MKTLKQFMESQKSCPQGQYYCYTDKKCKKIPTGYHMGRGGYLAKDNDDSSDDSKKGKKVKMETVMEMAMVTVVMEMVVAMVEEMAVVEESNR